MNWRSTGATIEDFAARHEYLSTSPDSGFVRVAVVQRGDRSQAQVLRGLVLSRIDEDGVSTSLLGSPIQWYGALAEVFGLSLDDVPPVERDGLWRRVLAAHKEYERASRPDSSDDP